MTLFCPQNHRSMRSFPFFFPPLNNHRPSLTEPNLILPTIISGRLCYFDRACGPNLIFANEWAQFAEVRKQGHVDCLAPMTHGMLDLNNLLRLLAACDL